MTSCTREKPGKEGAAEFDSKGSLQQRDTAVKNKAEQKQQNQNTVITMVWSVIQVKGKNNKGAATTDYT